MAGKSLNLRAMRALDEAQVPPRLGLRIIAVFLILEAALLIVLALIFPAHAAPAIAPVKGEVGVSTSAGYARLVFRLADEVPAEARIAGGILIISFKQPVAVAVERIAIGAPDYVSAARRDPDGTAVRLALNRKVTVNTMAAGEQLFVDLLPEGWVGLPPGLPQDVVDQLVQRAREAEKVERKRRQVVEQRQHPPIRLRVGTQPTFTRYVFELPDATPVTTEREKDKLTLVFDAPLRFDLAEAQESLPPSVSTISTEPGDDNNVSVRFAFAGAPDVRTFREDSNFIVDVLTAQAKDRVPDGPLAMLTELQAQTPVAPSPPPPPPAEAQPSPQAKPAAPAGAVASAAATEPAPQASVPPPPVPAANEAAGDQAPAAPRDPAAPVLVEVQKVGESLRLTFPFATPTPAAVFRRADAVWLVFDAQAPIDVSKIVTQSIGAVRTATVTRTRGGQVVRIKVDRPKLASVETDGLIWTVALGDLVLDPTRPLALNRGAEPSNASAVISFEAPQQLHRLADPEVGDTLLVVTALGPARGFVRAQNFVEFNALATTHGVAIQPVADDLAVELAADKIVVSRPAGLTLSNAAAPARFDTAEPARRPASSPSLVFDAQQWGFDRSADYVPRQAELIRAAAETPNNVRAAPRLDLARFYLSRDMGAEAKGVLDVAIAGEHQKSEEGPLRVAHAIASILMEHPVDALKDLGDPTVGDQFDAPVWRAVAFAHQGKWPQARTGFRGVDAALATMPAELQRLVLRSALAAAIEVRDFTEATRLLETLETLRVPADVAPAVELLKGRLAEGLGRIADALAAYDAAASSRDPGAAAQGRLRSLVLHNAMGKLKHAEVIDHLEGLAVTWRGDETELETLQLLERLYAEEGRYRDAFKAMRAALLAHADAEIARRIHDDAAATFESLFLGGKADALPPIEALSLFYDFRELTPVGRRGDEMIRRLADRLVSVDLLDQAAELLQHQIDHRLQGAARAQIAVRVAVIYLMSHKPDRAVQALQSTRTGDLPNEVRDQRLLLEARALSATGRHDLALELVVNLDGKQAQRLRGDVLWAARRWRAAGEAIEKLYSERWRDFTPLSEAERGDILRAGLAYSLADDALGLDRFRQKYAAKMGESVDRRAFEVATDHSAVDTAEFIAIARKISAVDTLDAFLRELRAQFPPAGAAAAPAPPGAARAL